MLSKFNTSLTAKVTVISVAFALFSCNKTEQINPISESELMSYPDHFPTPHYNFENNEFSTEGFELGKKIFFDKNLSSDQTISCASCHHQQFAFSDAGLPVSEGVEGRLGRRNSPPLFNLIWHKSFMWDGGINHIEIMPIAPFTDHAEMDLEMSEVVDLLNNSPVYRNAFQDVFNSSTIDSQKLLFVLTQYMGALVSGNSKYDKVERGETTFSQTELQGQSLFNAHCASCHTAPLFMDNKFHNNGIEPNIAVDEGRYEITQESNDIGKFKTPSLRNVMLTYPYMHDGKFMNIEEVIEHYSEGINATDNLSPLLPQGGFSFTNEEKNALIAFLKTLTDWEFVYDTRFSE
jgi:cytochrome c peroxidase